MDIKQQVFENFDVPDPIRIKKAVRLIRRYFEKIEGLNILECGIAKGGVVDLLKNEGVNCFGVDVNPRHLDGVNIKQVDLNDGIPDFGVKFDVIFAGEVVEHLFDDLKFMENAKNSLKQGGILIITVPNLVFVANRLLMFFGKMPLFAFAPYHYHIYNKKIAENLIKEKGFEILETISSHLLFSTRRNKLGRIFEILGDVFPSLGAHLIICAKNKKL
ncbi:MAG: class I SAM-dependent methyltransferase [Patescibacteria group bacterium]